MATTVYNDPWSPSDINCNWKPEKLSRYSFVENKIDFNAANVELGHSQISSYSVENPETNLTDYIEVSQSTYYSFKAKEGVSRGIRYVAYFDSNHAFLSYEIFSSQVTLEADFETPVNCVYIKLTIYKEAWEKCTLVLSSDSFLDKGTTPLNIVDNIEGEQIYKDLHFEVFVKAEAFIKNFVNCFNLAAFQRFPNDASYWYDIQNSIVLKCNTPNYYDLKYSFPNFIPNHEYHKGDMITGYIYVWGERYICLKDHTSASTFSDDYIDPTTYLNTGNWKNLEGAGNSANWLYIDKNIKEKNYSNEIGFPYVGSLVFKNLWGCDMLNYLDVYTKKSYLTICYHPFFAKNLRKTFSYYNKFFNQGYFDFVSGKKEGFGIRLLFGESFNSDEILGESSLNNYFILDEITHEIPENWNASQDSVNTSYFNGNLDKPFDHYYTFTPYRGIPFFKEKVFEDSKIELVLQKEDALGNIYQRVVDLPILITFTNNLIKCYFRDSSWDGTGIYTSEYLNSNAVNSFYYNHTEGHSGVRSDIRVWCPDIKKLSVSSTISNPGRVNEVPTIRNINGGDNPLWGQVGILHWSANELDVGETIRATHILEYSDGANYDKFTFIEEIERRS